jgi:phosphoribosylaminoimidazole (AIR) synthetase
LAAEIDRTSWPRQPIFELLKRIGDVPEEDYRRTFNLGVGMVLVVSEKKIRFVSQILRKLREPFYRIGRVSKLSSPRGARVVYL